MSKAHHPRWTLVASVLASSLSFVEGSVLNVALPAIRAGYAVVAASGAALIFVRSLTMRQASGQSCTRSPC